MAYTYQQLEQLLGKQKAQEVWLANQSGVADTSPDLEPTAGNEPLGEEKTQGHDPRCCIHVHSVRATLADPDGVSAKAAIDGLILGGLLPDDSPKEVKQVTYSQEKCKKGQEKTVIILEWSE